MSITDPEKRELLEAIAKNDLEYVKKAVAKYGNKEINKLRTPDDISPLFDAIFYSAPNDQNFEMVKILLEGLDIESSVYKEQDEDHKDYSYTALIGACKHGKIHIVKYLLEKGANMYSPTDDGSTAFTKAIQSKNLEICKLLIKHGFDVTYNETHYKGKVATRNRSYLHEAVLYNFPEAAKLLLDKGIPATVTYSKNGSTPFHFVAEYNALIVGEMLIKHMAKKGIPPRVFVNSANALSDTALHLAALSGSIEAAEFLLKNGADITARNNDGQTPLELAKFLVKSENKDLSELINYLTKMEKEVAEGRFVYTPDAEMLAILNQHEPIVGTIAHVHRALQDHSEALGHLDRRVSGVEAAVAEINVRMNRMHADLANELSRVNLENRQELEGAMKRHFEKYDAFTAQLAQRHNGLVRLYDNMQGKIEELRHGHGQSDKVAELERKLAPIAAEYEASVRNQRQIADIKKNPRLALFYAHVQKYMMGYLLGNVAVNSGVVEGVDSAGIQALGVGESFFEKAAGLFGLGTWGEIAGKVLFAGGRKYLEYVQDQERGNVANLAANLMEMDEIIEGTARKLTCRNVEILKGCVSDADVEKLAIAATARLRISMNRDDSQNMDTEQKINQLVSAVEKPITTLKGNAQQLLCRILNKCYIKIETAEHGVSSMFQEHVFTKCSLKCKDAAGNIQKYLPIPEQTSSQELKNALDVSSRIGSRRVKQEEVEGKFNLTLARKELARQNNGFPTARQAVTHDGRAANGFLLPPPPQNLTSSPRMSPDISPEGSPKQNGFAQRMAPFRQKSPGLGI